MSTLEKRVPYVARAEDHLQLSTGNHAQKIISHFLQGNGPGIFQHDNAGPHKARK